MRGAILPLACRRTVARPPLPLPHTRRAGFLCVMLPKLQEKRAIGQACLDFDHSVLSQPSGNEKRRLEGKQARAATAAAARPARLGARFALAQPPPALFVPRGPWPRPSPPLFTVTRLRRCAPRKSSGPRTGRALRPSS